MTNLFFNGYVSGEWTDNIVDVNSGAIIYTNFTFNYSPTAGDNVEVGPGSPYSTVTIDRSDYEHTFIPVGVNKLTIDAGITLIEDTGALKVSGTLTNSGVFIRNTTGGPLVVSGSAIVNNGLMTINGVYDYDGMIIAPGSTSLTGSGNLRLRSADLTISDPNGIAYLANASTISGSGIIGQAGNNNAPDGPVVIHNTASGIVDADVGGQILRISPGTTPAVNPTINSGLFEATAGSQLLFYDGNLDQSGNGTLAAYGAGSTVVLAGVVVRGGFIDGSGGGIVESGSFSGNGGSQPDTIDGRSAANGGLGAVTIKTGAILESTGLGLTLVGSIVNKGEILDQNALTIGAGDLTLTGGGSFVMAYPGDNYDSHLAGYNPSVTSTLHNVDNTLSGSGIIDVAIDNQANASVLANNADRDLTLDGITVSNAGNLESSLGSLEIAGSTISQSGTGAIVADGGNGSTAHVDLYNATTIVGGKLATVNGGKIQTGLAGIGFGGVGVTLDGSTGAGEVSNLGTLIDAYEKLNLKGSIANAGTLSVKNALAIVGVTLTGGGKVVLGDTGAAVSGDSLVNKDNTFSGAGTFGAGLQFDNRASGTLNASSSAVQMVIQTGNTLTNAGLIEATGAAGLDLSNVTVDDRTGGQLVVGNGSTVDLDTATVLGGSLKGSGSGSFSVINSANSFSFLANTSIAATVRVVGYTVLYVSGTISNSGQIIVDDGSANATTTLNVAGTWTGGGKISLSSAAGNVLGIYGSFTNVDNVITGAGTIQGSGGTANTFVNDGTVDATFAANALSIGVGSTLTNNGTLKADAGTLRVTDGVTGSGSALVTDGGTLDFANSFGQSVTFQGAGTLLFEENATFNVALNGFGSGDIVDFANGGATATYDSAQHRLTVSSNGSTVGTLTIAGANSADRYGLVSDGQGGQMLAVAPRLTSASVSIGATTQQGTAVSLAGTVIDPVAIASVMVVNNGTSLGQAVLSGTSYSFTAPIPGGTLDGITVTAADTAGSSTTQPITGLGTLAFTNAGSAATLSASKLLPNAAINGGGFGTDTLTLTGQNIDLSRLTLSNWTSSDRLIAQGLNGQTNLLRGSAAVKTTLLGGNGTDVFYVQGGAGPDIIDGGAGTNLVNTSFAAGSGTVLVDLRDGYLVQGSQTDAYFANIQGAQLGNGPSTVVGLTSGTDQVAAGSGTTAFYGEGATDYVQGGTGTDAFVGSTGTEVFGSGGGNDYMVGGSGLNVMTGGTGTDHFYGEGGTDYLYAGTNYNVLTGFAGPGGHESLFGSSGTDILYGGGGTSYLLGAGGYEVLVGGTGLNDLVGATHADGQGHLGTNVLVGGTGTGAGTDVFQGGIGTNIFYEGSGTDTFAGSSGYDTIYGGSGTSTITGGSGTDVIFTGAGNQHVFAGTGTTLLNETAATLTAGRLDRIDQFQVASTATGGKGTFIALPSGSAATTSFVAASGGTAIFTQATGGSGTAEIFVSNTSLLDVQHQTLFNL